MSRDWLTPGNILQAAGIAVVVALWVADRAMPASAGPPDLRDAVEVLGTLAPWLLVVLLVAGLARVSVANSRAHHRAERANEALRAVRKHLEAVQVSLAEALCLLEGTQQDPAGHIDDSSDVAVAPAWLDGWNDGAGRLLLRDCDLETAYDGATSNLQSKGFGGRLSDFMLTFLPFGRPALLDMRFSFLSTEAQQVYRVWARLNVGPSGTAFDISLDAGEARRPLPFDRVFEVLPWRVQPRWAEMVRVAALRHGSVAVEPKCRVLVTTSAGRSMPSWSITLIDFGNRCLSVYDGTSPENLVPSLDRAWLSL
jgi:hypothetical protein